MSIEYPSPELLQLARFSYGLFLKAHATAEELLIEVGFPPEQRNYPDFDAALELFIEEDRELFFEDLWEFRDELSQTVAAALWRPAFRPRS
jgi:hypothetical protein